MPHLIVIEDEPDVASLLAYAFASAGFSVATAPDGMAGLHAVQARHPDLILLDLLLPRLDGREVLQVLKADPETRDIPVVVVSAVVDATSRLAVLNQGAADFVAKPCSVKEVVRRARAALDRTEADDADEGEGEPNHAGSHDPHCG
jgi:two-component system phosphate regulon response regulator PhoB